MNMESHWVGKCKTCGTAVHVLEVYKCIICHIEVCRA